MLLLFCVDLIEKDLRTKIAYFLGEAYNRDGYLSKENFSVRAVFSVHAVSLRYLSTSNVNKDNQF